MSQNYNQQDPYYNQGYQNQNPNYGYYQQGQGFNQPQGQAPGGYGQGGYDQGAYNQGGYNQGGYNQGGYNAPYYPTQPGYANAQAPPPSYDNGGTSQGQKHAPKNYHQPPPPQNAPPSNYNGAPPRQSPSADKWNDKPKYQDVWAAVLYLLNLIALVTVSVISIKRFDWNTQSTNWSASSTNVLVDNSKLGGMIGMAGGIAIVLAVVYFVLMLKFTRAMIVISYWFNVLYIIAMAVVFFVRGSFIGGIIWAVIAALYVFLWFSWRKRIPFATIILQTVCSITKKYPATMFAVFLSIIVQTAFTFLHMAALITLPQSFSDGGLVVLIVFLMFSWYWTSQVIKNVLHVTISGVFATFYFFGVEEERNSGKIVVPVKNPTAASFGRAITTSFGSICFGSLLVAILQTIRFVLRSLENQSREDGNTFAAICLCCIQCIIGMIENLVEYFNKWAYAQVAIYGKPYCQAAKDTWALCKSRGVDAIINDSLVDNVLFMGTMVAALICAVACYFFAQSQNMITVIPSDDTVLTGYKFLMATIGLLIGVVIFSITNSVIDSGTIATFVCLAEDPAALARTKPQLFEEIRQRYPQVVLHG